AEERRAGRREAWSGASVAWGPDSSTSALLGTLQPQDGKDRSQGGEARVSPQGDAGSLLADPASASGLEDLFASVLSDPLGGSGASRSASTASGRVADPGPTGSVPAFAGGAGEVSSAVTGHDPAARSGATRPVNGAAGTSGSTDATALSFYAGLERLAVPAPPAASAPPTLVSRVHARFDLADTTAGPFPSHRFTVPDHTQNTR